MGKQFTVESQDLKVPSSLDGDSAGDSKLECGSPLEGGGKLPHSKIIFLRGGTRMTRTFSRVMRPAVNHFVEAGENLLYTLGGLDDFEDDRQILRERRSLSVVVDAGALRSRPTPRRICLSSSKSSSPPSV